MNSGALFVLQIVSNSSAELFALRRCKAYQADLLVMGLGDCNMPAYETSRFTYSYLMCARIRFVRYLK
jgi:hypothetical protein